MISKELFNEVMNLHNLDFEYPLEYYNTNNSIRFWVIENPKYQSTSNYINIYELAHKCKEWATFKNGKNIITERDISGVYSYIIFMIGITIHNEYLDDTTRILANFKADTEPEAIFKACQWILENKN